ncbi:MAG: heterodisulfide reductase-related iron-sulfur binding cluster, partial [Pseudomonadales bacterium]
MTKCPYVPPHEWNVDFPHLMLQAKAQRYKKSGASFRDNTLTNTDMVGKLASIPLVDVTVNAFNGNGTFRKVLESTFGVHHQAPVPKYYSKTLRKRFENHPTAIKPGGETTGKVALYATCYCNVSTPDLGEDFVKVFEHNGVQIDLVPNEVCCGMPKLELGDLDRVDALKRKNIPDLARLVDEGYDLIAPIPSCVLMYKQELPLMYPDDADVKKVQ